MRPSADRRSERSETEAARYTVRTSSGLKDFGTDGGHVLPHEHFLLDMRSYWEHGSHEDYPLEKIEEGLIQVHLDAHRRNPQGTSLENLVLSDWYLAAIEMNDARLHGCQLVVDVTPSNIGFGHDQVVRASKLARLPVVLSVGRYLESTLDSDEAAKSAKMVAREWIDRIENASENLQIGIIGEIGTSETLGSAEVRSLAAAAETQSATGLPINIHLEPAGYQGHKVLDILEDNGATVSRVALSHCDGQLDVPFLSELAARGAYIEFDLFGTGPDWKVRGRGFESDERRIEALGELGAAGFSTRLLLSHDICMKNSLRRYGGWGYSHIGRTVLPAISEMYGNDFSTLISAENPLKLLSLAVKDV